MAILTIEYFTDHNPSTRAEQCVYGSLISSVEDTSLTTTPEHSTVPAGALYASIYSDTACYIEIGNGNQDCGSTRRSTLPAGSRLDFSVRPTDTISYRSIS